MTIRRFVTRVAHAAVAALLTAIVPAVPAFAQGDHSHGVTADQSVKAAGLVKVVREATERFRDVRVAEAEGYALQFGCVSGPDAGAMGMHFVNFPLVLDGEIDPRRPEIVIYEPQPDGRLRLIGADYL